MALQQIVEQTVTGLGYDLVEIERTAGGLLRITIDLPWQAPEEGAPELPEQFVTVEDCEKVTRQLQVALEVDGADDTRPGRATVVFDHDTRALFDPKAAQRRAWEDYRMTEWGNGRPELLEELGMLMQATDLRESRG